MMVERYKTLHANLVKLKTDTYKLRQKLKYKIISDQSFQRSLSAVEEVKSAQTSNPDLLAEIQTPSDVSNSNSKILGNVRNEENLTFPIFFLGFKLVIS